MNNKNKNYVLNYDSVSDENVLALYLKQISRIPLLSREEEEKYAALAASGDKEAKDILVKSNLRFVVNVAKKFQNQGVPLTDLISEGNIGLMTAVEKFDVTKGFHFISYAVWWIRQAILKAICEKSRMIRLPLNRANEIVQIEKAKKALHGSYSEEEEIEKISEMLNMEKSHVREMINITRDMVSLDLPVFDERDSSTLGDFVEDSTYQLPENYVINENLKCEIDKVLDTLSEKEADVIRYRFGLNGLSPKSLKEIGEIYSLTKERIRQIEKKAIKRLQHSSRKAHLEPFVA
ncbi:MAG: RNA polymerase sigma factor RpoD/SigA [Spirochaetes bacterium]|uniref:RNA polymerase sigma factor n=1 Tax=Candidatus Gallitreponema excrementavium TaxID=2840840 RepID=A0A9D9N1H7_9SPIR|nr:RNA polymerase sigma factor RpoD/SigA [Candidatus Gallitreponema excrementavium]